MHYISDYVSKELQDAGVKVHTGEGGFYLYVDFENFKEQFKKKGIRNSKEMCIHLLENYSLAKFIFIKVLNRYCTSCWRILP